MTEELNHAFDRAVAAMDQKASRAKSTSIVTVLIVTTMLWFSVMLMTWMYFRNIDDRLSVRPAEVLLEVQRSLEVQPREVLEAIEEYLEVKPSEVKAEIEATHEDLVARLERLEQMLQPDMD